MLFNPDKNMMFWMKKRHLPNWDTIFLATQKHQLAYSLSKQFGAQNLHRCGLLKSNYLFVSFLCHLDHRVRRTSNVTWWHVMQFRSSSGTITWSRLGLAPDRSCLNWFQDSDSLHATLFSDPPKFSLSLSGTPPPPPTCVQYSDPEDPWVRATVAKWEDGGEEGEVMKKLVCVWLLSTKSTTCDHILQLLVSDLQNFVACGNLDLSIFYWTCLHKLFMYSCVMVIQVSMWCLDKGVWDWFETWVCCWSIQHQYVSGCHWDILWTIMARSHN